MKGKGVPILVIVALVLVAMLVVPLAGCKGEVSVTTASLSEATMCSSIDSQTKRPAEKADVFSTNTPEIYCSVKLSNAPPNTEVKAVWIYVQGEAKDLKDYTITEYPMTADGTRYLSFSVTQPTAGWPRGDYMIKLFVDGKERLTVPFSVQ
jgi:hypothetical protein